MVVTDGTHLVSTDLDELHAFAASIGLKREWFQDHTRHPHYDLFGCKVKQALEAGALEVDAETCVKIANSELQGAWVKT